jgi:serine/threonine protein kinase
MSQTRAVNAEPIPGYRLLAPLGRGGFGEVWKCEAPGGLHKAIKFVRGADGPLAGRSGAEQELRALQHIKGIRHTFLLSIERAELIEGDLVLVMELADRNLHDLFQEQRAAGRPGVARAQLLRCLGEAAEVLDLMNQEHGLQHLDIKPQNLFLVGGHVKVADFGLVNSLAELAGAGPAALQQLAVTPLYAAPEVFLGKVTLFSDQYSLAITYQELLTGTLPFNGKNARQLLMQHTTAEPDLRPLPETDRPLVARALAKDARQRFPSCSDFVRALESGVAAPEPDRARTGATMADFSLGGLTSTPVMSASPSRPTPRSLLPRTPS